MGDSTEAARARRGSPAARNGLSTNTDARSELVIRARRTHDEVAADPDRFRPVAEALVAEARRARQPEALALALRAVAWAERARQDDRSAIKLLNEGCRIARRYRLDDTLAELLMSHAAISQELGQMSVARRDLQAAARLVTGARASELNFHRAVLLQNTGRLADAETLYLGVLADPTAPARRKGQCANNLALIEAEQGRYSRALRRLSEALPAAERIGPALAVTVMQSRAWVTVQSGRFGAGLRMFEEAADAYRAAGLPLGEHYIEYADALMELRLLPEAVSAARRAAAEFTAAGIPLMAAEAELRVAQLAMLAGDGAEAISASVSAAAAFRRQTRPAWRARTVVVAAEAKLVRGSATLADLREVTGAARRLGLAGMTSAAVQAFLVTGRLAAALGRHRQAIAAHTRAAALARGASVLVRLRGQVSSALAARLRNRDREALAHCRRGLSDLARHRSSLPSVELRALASGHGAELGRIGFDIVVGHGSAGRVLNWMERSRAAALLAVEPPEYEEIRADLTALRAAHSRPRDEAVHGAALATRPYLRDGKMATERAAIESRIRQATWRAELATERATAPVTLGVLREVLAGRTLVAYGRRGEDLVAVVIEPRRSSIAAVGPLGPVREQLRAFLFAVRRLAAPRLAAQRAAARASADLRLHRLAELLLVPLRVPADAELVIVPVSSLQGIPWSALHGGPLCLAPSATFWARSALAAQDRSGGTAEAVVLVAGPDLPGAVAEVGALAGIHPAATSITPPSSTAETVAAALDGADLAHLACHGTLRSDNPMFSALLLSDGPLTVQELYARGLAPHRLVLAACESGAGVSYAGDEVLGFVSALLARGTAGIVASTAAVPDVDAVDLMTALHRQLARGDTLAHALHVARESQDTDDSGSYVNWCTFNAHGAA
jgi:tetratricopeptide (TPR) repeat protein